MLNNVYGAFTCFVQNSFYIYIKVHKTNTALLLKITKPHDHQPENVEVEEFGYSAERRYSNIMGGESSDDEKDKYFLFKKFKLMLYEVGNFLFFECAHFNRYLIVFQEHKFCKIVFMNSAPSTVALRSKASEKLK